MRINPRKARCPFCSGRVNEIGVVFSREPDGYERVEARCEAGHCLRLTVKAEAEAQSLKIKARRK